MFDTSHLHPMIVHFPIALVVVGLFFEIIFYRKGDDEKPICGELILYMACLAAIVALTTGIFFTRPLSGGALAIKEQHELFAIFSTIFLVLTSAVYLYRRFSGKDKKILNLIGLFLYIVAFALVGATGFLGGNLVYSYMIGL
jgi:uncharacterized membrane protein